jgi:hypothetical protein
MEMRVSFNIGYFLLTVIFFTSCDPAKVLIIKAGKTNTRVHVYANNKILPFSDGVNNAKMVIRVPSNDTTEKAFYYGLGGWSKNGVSRLASDIDSIIIVNRFDTISLKITADIENYLWKHTGGMHEAG